MGPHYLGRLFTPQSIAVIGASNRPGSVGHIVFHNLLKGDFTGKLFAVNPKHLKVQKHKAYPSIEAIGLPVDLAVIATPAASVPDIIRQCGEYGVHAAVVLSAGFGESGDHGAQLQAEMLKHARHYGVRIVGPNCLGIMRPHNALNATFSRNIALPGQMALVSQSGALCTAILDWAESRGIGFSTVVSLGDAADVDFGDVLNYLALDPHTHSILLYVEGIGDARGFISGLRIAARLKPVVVVKAGRYEEGTRAAISHTGAMVGSDEVFHAALRRAGVVRAYTIKQLFAAAELLASGDYQVHGNRLAIITNGGGPGVMATDRATEQQLTLAELSGDTLDTLDKLLPDYWSHGNPVDILGDADPNRYRGAVEACLRDPAVDGLLVMLSPQAMTDSLGAATAVVEAIGGSHKPVLTCWMGAGQVAAAHTLFTARRIPHFDTPEASVEAFSYLASYRRNQQLLLQVPGPLGRRSEPDVEGARLIIEEALADGRSQLSSLETHAVLHAFGVPVVQSLEARDANQALVLAETLGFPLAMKINSPDISHKSDVAGVRLNINNAATVRSVFKELLETAQTKRPDAVIDGITLEPMYNRPYGRELLVGVVRDPVFGPAISVGAGGTMVEVIDDRAVTLPPLNRYIARRVIERTRVSRLLGEFRGKPAVNMTELENVLLRVSEMVCELPHIMEMDINPLIIDDQGALAVDARMMVSYPAPGATPYAHMAIHPYPADLISHEQLADGSDITIRPIRPEDARIEADLVRRLSPESKYFRFMRSLQELTPEMLVRFTQIDYDLEMALIATQQQSGSDQEIELGVARYAINADGESCEFAIVVADEWHHKGLGIRLMKQLMAIARKRGLKVMEGEVLSGNVHMRNLANSLGFTISNSPDDPGLKLMRQSL